MDNCRLLVIKKKNKHEKRKKKILIEKSKIVLVTKLKKKLNFWFLKIDKVVLRRYSAPYCHQKQFALVKQ